jgi:hypothetical protein
MDGLIEIVTASFARHGIQCPDSASRPSWKQAAPSTGPAQDMKTKAADPVQSAALPKHNFRPLSEGDPAP